MIDPDTPHPDPSEAEALAMLRTIHHSLLALDLLRAGASRAEVEGEAVNDISQLLENLLALPVSVEYRSRWFVLGDEPIPGEMRMTLASGASPLLPTPGPAVQIRCRLNAAGPTEPTLEHRDWFESWESLSPQAMESADLDPVAASHSLHRFAHLLHVDPD